MKKSFFFVAALALTFAACNKGEEPLRYVENPADLEDIDLAPENLYKLAATGTFESGEFIFKQDAQPSNLYYSCNVVSSITNTDFTDYNDAWKSAKGGAHEGQNYIVWNMDFYGQDTIYLKSTGIVPGFYVTNSIYTYNSIMNGDYSGPAFTDEDWFKLTITGVRNKVATGTVDFYLAQGKNPVVDWTYVDLSKLGMIDGLFFTLTGSRNNEYGLLTPSYCAFVDLGAKLETAKVE